MVGYVVRRLIQGVAVALGVTLVVFFATRWIGDPVRRMLPIDATHAQYVALSHQIGFDKPILTQLRTFLTGIPHLQLGRSAWLDQPVVDALRQHLGNTIRLISAGLTTATVFGVALGTTAALQAGRWLDRLITTVTLALASLPWFWTGALCILIFAVRLQWLPTSGSDQGIRSLILPTVALALPITGRLTQVVRHSVLTQLGEPYVATALAKGITRRRILLRHVPRNALLPVASFLGWETIRSIGASTVVVETVFGYAGIGYLAVQAAQRQDVILLQSTVLLVALMIVVCYLVFDILYMIIDPRLRGRP
ncbi:MAG: ABC transporter permease [Nocardioides sp.]